ncbi:MAG: phosphoadenylyl-sulfate reductase [Bacteroidales bacterium]|jgi:phosphoadenosine phosphosulfate reductase|nr:phosphoadenylyl-sulfate reductase [Bacteroidales bacterium]
MDLYKINCAVEGKSAENGLSALAVMFPGKVVFTTSFGIEDQVILHKIVTNGIDIKVATIDTGRLFSETYEVFWQTLNRFDKKIHVYFPNYKSVEKIVSASGPYSFFNSVEERKECCRIRKVLPLRRAIEGMRVWVSGIRAKQSNERGQMQQIEYDEQRRMFKYYPLFDWRFDDVRRYIDEKYVPYNVLHDSGFMSIGCQPCTRKVEPGEDFRAGRWWWEEGVSKECGCHED